MCVQNHSVSAYVIVYLFNYWVSDLDLPRWCLIEYIGHAKSPSIKQGVLWKASEVIVEACYVDKLTLIAFTTPTLYLFVVDDAKC